MRRSFIFTGLAIISLCACAGCDAAKWSFPKGRFRLISFPTEAAAPNTQPAHTQTVAAKDKEQGAQAKDGDANDPAVAQLNETVQDFVARFPPPDPDHNGQHPSATNGKRGTPATQPDVARANPPRTSAGPTTAPANARAQPTGPGTHADLPEPAGSAVPVKAAANASVSIEAAASPQPPAAPQPIGPSPGQPTVEIIDIRPAAEPQPQPDAPTASANQPVRKGPQPESGDISRLIAQLEEAVGQHPQQMDDQFKLRLLYLATGQTDRAVAPFNNVDPVQAELLSALFKTMAGAHDALREPAKGSRSALAAAADLQRLLAEQSPVMISKMALVTAVSSFGDYRPIDPPLFPAGQPVHVFCYCEVGNFHSEPTRDGRLRTLLAATLEVFDHTGKIVWQQNIAQIEDLVHTPRRDFFLPLEIKLPATLPPGEYVLKVGIEDKLAATTDQQRLTFTIGK